MLDISDEPRWGRVAESLGEAPVLAGRLGAAMVRGFQGETLGVAGTRDAGTRDAGTVAACAKHFVGYGLLAVHRVTPSRSARGLPPAVTLLRCP